MKPKGAYNANDTQKRFRFLEMDIDMTPQKWRCLNWEGTRDGRREARN
jgi:hypothetical protein